MGEAASESALSPIRKAWRFDLGKWTAWIAKAAGLFVTAALFPAALYLGEVVQETLDASFSVPSSIDQMRTQEKFTLGMTALIRSFSVEAVSRFFNSLAPPIVAVVFVVGSAAKFWRATPPSLRAWIVRLLPRIHAALMRGSTRILTLFVASVAALQLALLPVSAAFWLFSLSLKETRLYAQNLAHERQAMALRCGKGLPARSDLPCIVIETDDGFTFSGLWVSSAGDSYHLADGHATHPIAMSDVKSVRVCKTTCPHES